MPEEQVQLTDEQRVLLRVGAVCAVLGSIVSVAAGTGFGNLTNSAGAESVLRHIAARPEWYWPLVHLGFIAGALLWVGAFIALHGSLRDGASRALGRLGAVGVILGATVHIIDSSIDGFGLTALSSAWAAAPASQQTDVLHTTVALLLILHGTWAGVISFFHGVPFVLLGLALIFSRTYPVWLGWVGVIGGLGSLVAGITMFFGVGFFESGLFVVFAIVVSVFMLVMGALMWRHAGSEQGMLSAGTGA